MAILIEKKRYALQAEAAGSTDELKFEMPNPGDVFLIVAFAWAALCFLMVTFGTQLARRAASLSGSKVIRDFILADQTAIAGLMIVGILGIAAAFWFINRYKRWALAVFLYALPTASFTWQPVHDTSFLMKYLFIVYAATYGALFFVKNGWRLWSHKFYRLCLIYIGWILFIVVLNGGRVGDIWYFATEFTLMIGIGIAWCLEIKTREDLIWFNRTFAFVAIIISIYQYISPLIVSELFIGGRFVGMIGRSTRFGGVYSVFVVAMFWMAMYEPKQILRRLFLVLATVGLGLVMLSGTRNATVATIAAILVLWWVFRDKLLIYFGFVGIVGVLLTAIVGGPSDNVQMLTERLQSLDNQRLDAWTLYGNLVVESPLFGYGYDGVARAVYNEDLVALVSQYRKVNAPGVHNSYLGFAVRWGLIGLLWLLVIYYVAFRQAWKVIFNKAVPKEDKKAYILPCAMCTLVFLEGLLEDMIGSTGKGNIHNFLYGVYPIIMYVFGTRLLRNAENKESETAAKDELVMQSVVRPELGRG